MLHPMAAPQPLDRHKDNSLTTVIRETLAAVRFTLRVAFSSRCFRYSRDLPWITANISPRSNHTLVKLLILSARAVVPNHLQFQTQPG